MQVAEKKVEGLKRSYVVTVPRSEIQTQVEAKLAEIAATARLPGFRPGKAPLTLLKQRYGESVRAEILEETINRTSRDLMSERGLRPAMQPKVELEAFGEDKDLSYALSLEVLPEVTPVDFKTIRIERLTVPVEESEVEKALADLAKMRRPTRKVEETRAARNGDTLKIDFDGTVDGESRPGMKAEGFMLELGSGSFIPGFEDQLVGQKAGDSTVVTVTFPAGYHAKDLAGKEAAFKVAVHELHEPTEVEINDDFAKGFGQDDLASLKELVRKNIADSYKGAARTHAKRDLLDKLAEAHDFPVPEGMVTFEFESIWQQRAQQGPDPEEKGSTEEEIKQEYRAIAERRVRLGLLLAEIGRKQNLDVSQDDLRQAIFARAREFPGQERAVVDYYLKNQEALNSLRAPLFEEKVVDYLFELVDVTEKPGTVADLKGESGDTPDDAEAKEKPKSKKKADSKKS